MISILVPESPVERADARSVTWHHVFVHAFRPVSLAAALALSGCCFASSSTPTASQTELGRWNASDPAPFRGPDYGLDVRVRALFAQSYVDLTVSSRGTGQPGPWLEQVVVTLDDNPAACALGPSTLELGSGNLRTEQPPLAVTIPCTYAASASDHAPGGRGRRDIAFGVGSLGWVLTAETGIAPASCHGRTQLDAATNDEAVELCLLP